MTQPFYNTTNEEGQYLIRLETKALGLEERVLEIYCANPTKGFAWFEVLALLPQNTCEGSVKRAITNNKTNGFLDKTTEKAISPYGSPCYKYKLKTT